MAKRNRKKRLTDEEREEREQELIAKLFGVKNKDEYIGNIWGWKWSFIALGFISFMFLILLLRWATFEPKPIKSLEEIRLIDSLSKVDSLARLDSLSN